MEQEHQAVQCRMGFVPAGFVVELVLNGAVFEHRPMVVQQSLAIACKCAGLPMSGQKPVRKRPAISLAADVLAAMPHDADDQLYARVDVAPGPDGTPVLMELELVEPSLFLARKPGAADRLVARLARELRA